MWCQQHQQDIIEQSDTIYRKSKLALNMAARLEIIFVYDTKAIALLFDKKCRTGNPSYIVCDDGLQHLMGFSDEKSGIKQLAAKHDFVVTPVLVSIKKEGVLNTQAYYEKMKAEHEMKINVVRWIDNVLAQLKQQMDQDNTKIVSDLVIFKKNILNPDLLGEGGNKVRDITIKAIINHWLDAVPAEVKENERVKALITKIDKAYGDKKIV